MDAQNQKVQPPPASSEIPPSQIPDKWYNNKLKLGLSILFWPILAYGIYKTDLIEQKTKKIIAVAFMVLMILGIFNGDPDYNGIYEDINTPQAYRTTAVLKDDNSCAIWLSCSNCAPIYGKYEIDEGEFDKDIYEKVYYIEIVDYQLPNSSYQPPNHWVWKLYKQKDATRWKIHIPEINQYLTQTDKTNE